MAIISYAQNHEDVLLNRLFPEASNGFYIDVGACHPVFHSVTKLFYERGWHGINIEPMRDVFDMLAKDRQGDINLNIGVSNREGTSTFYECPTYPGSSTFCQEQAEHLRRHGFELVERSMPVKTLARLCEQYAGRTIEFIKVDVESHEREVLEGADWSRYRPRVVLVEATRPNTNIPSHEHWEPILLAANYLFAFFDGLNRYYVRAEDRQLLSLLGAPVNVFDDYEIYETQRHLDDLRGALAASEQSLAETQGALALARAGLDQAQHALIVTRQAFDASQFELRARLDATEAQLAPFQELGPIAFSVAQSLRRMSLQSPKLAAIAKRVICSVHPRVRALVQEA